MDSVLVAEERAQACLGACNDVMIDDEDDELLGLLTPDVVIEVVETTSYVLNGPHELAERLRRSAYHGGLELFDVELDGSDIVMGVAWADEPTLRVAEVRLVLRGQQIERIEWME